MLKKIAVVIFALICSASSMAKKNVSDYVDNLVQKSLTILRDESNTTSEKMKKSEILISENLDLEWMSKFVLGKYRRILSKEEFQDFSKLYSEFIIKSYSNAVKFYKPSHSVKILSQSNISAEEYVVKTSLNSPDADPIRIDYVIRRFDNSGFKVFDIVTEGISLINSNQAEFTNIISTGSFQDLKKDLKAKIEALNRGK
ncbi:MAG: ABC transporter substrate-binding protein [Rickettsiaceae bacterium]|nr:ABC transporter substrate-binding protein [Rickettsiaceae bacterium]